MKYIKLLEMNELDPFDEEDWNEEDWNEDDEYKYEGMWLVFKQFTSLNGFKYYIGKINKKYEINCLNGIINLKYHLIQPMKIKEINRIKNNRIEIYPINPNKEWYFMNTSDKRRKKLTDIKNIFNIDDNMIIYGDAIYMNDKNLYLKK